MRSREYRRHGLDVVGINGVASKSSKSKIVDTINSVIYKSGCCGSMHSTTAPGFERTLIYPKEWLPENLEGRLEELVEIFNSFEGNLEYLGTVNTEEHNIKDIKFKMAVNVGASVAYGQPDAESCIITGNDWVCFLIKNSDQRTKLENYFSFCLIRCLFSGNYQNIYLDMLDIKEAFPEFSWFECFQIANYGWIYSGGNGFLYGHLPQELTTLGRFKEALKGTCLNLAFGKFKTNIQKSQLMVLYKEGKYDQIRELLR